MHTDAHRYYYIFKSADFSIIPCRKAGLGFAIQGFRRTNSPAISALAPSMAAENRDVLSELMTYMDVLMSPEAGCRKRPGMYLRVPVKQTSALHKLQNYTRLLRNH
jgi:hypothetical protein